LYINESFSLTALFTSSFLAATLLPGGSEVVLFAVLNNFPDTFWITLVIATVGNTLGGMVSFGMGWLLPQNTQLKHVQPIRAYGTPALLLAWMPLLGDALCLAAGWLRLNPWHAGLFMATGKFVRYWVVAAMLV
jgi:membrane protein YqaA with SNARE-associated domain